MLDIPIKEIKKFRADIISYFEVNYQEIVDEINETKQLSDGLEERIIACTREFKGR